MAVNLWRVERNAVVHGITKSEPGTPTADIKPFIERAKAAAENGAALARSVSNWHKQQMRKKFALRPARSSND
jgi:tRNA (Thr-GGU) A37 N-methylase